MRYSIQGTLFPAVSVELDEGESVYSEAGNMSWMSENVRFDTSTRGGLLEGIKRRFAGESVFLNTFICEEGTGVVTFSSEFPGKVVTVEISPGKELICQKDAFMCATQEVELRMHFRKRLGAGLFGGEGFILQRLSGSGTAFVELAGEVIETDLKPGEKLLIDPGHIAMYEPSVDFDIQLVRGFKNVLLGGEGVFLATLVGPGRVWLQTLPVEDLMQTLRKHTAGGSRNPLRMLFDLFT